MLLILLLMLTSCLDNLLQRLLIQAWMYDNDQNEASNNGDDQLQT